MWSKYIKLPAKKRVKESCEFWVKTKISKVFSLACGGFSDDLIKQYFPKLKWKHIVCIYVSGQKHCVRAIFFFRRRKPSFNHVVSLSGSTDHSQMSSLEMFQI